jgi:hypothetical protein
MPSGLRQDERQTNRTPSGFDNKLGVFRTTTHEGTMDYFQGVVTEYLRADRAMFVNTECCIQLNPGANPDRTGPHWFCDAVAVNLRDSEAFLCEVTYSKTLGALTKRLTNWAESWALLRVALTRDCGLVPEWPVRPWLFVPADLRKLLDQKLITIPNVGDEAGKMPFPKVTNLEDVTPWKYKSWNRHEESPSADA